jgi:hypothetical protein
MVRTYNQEKWYGMLVVRWVRWARHRPTAGRFCPSDLVSPMLIL